MILRLLFACVASLSFLSPLSAQTSLDVASLLSDQVAAAPRLSVPEILTRAVGLRELAAPHGRDEGDAELRELDVELERRLKDAADPKSVLFLAACHLQSEQPTADVTARALMPLLDDESDEIAIAAAELLGSAAFKRLPDPDLAEKRLAALIEGARDGELSPERRLASAIAAYKTGGGTERRQARAEMLVFLESRDPLVRKQGALTLGRIGEPVRGKLRNELQRIAGLPGLDAALAESYLKQEEMQTLHERKFQDLRETYAKQQLPADLAEIDAVMRMIEVQHLDGEKVTREDMVTAAANGMLGMLDQHSAYLPPEFFKRFTQDLEAEYGGIGAYVDVDPADGIFTITRPIYSGPAYQAGLQSDDKIVRIDDWSTLPENREEIIKRLKGEPGTRVKLYVWRRGMDPDLRERPTEDMIVEIERAQIEIPALSDQLLPGNVGLIDLREFSRVTSRELRASIKSMSERGMQALVLDLRRNSGGLLSEARNVADLFLPRGGLKVVSTEGRQGTVETLETRVNAVIPEDMPVLVLTSRFTASAAEIVAGALQDHGRAVVVGQRSYGKGSVQQLLPIEGIQDDEFEDSNGNGRWDDWEAILTDRNGNGQFDYAPRVKLTVAKYILPSGRSIHHEIDREHNIVSEGGIDPDVLVGLPHFLDAWKYEERFEIQKKRSARDYVDDHWYEHRDLFHELAIYDAKDPDRYPDFDEFLAGLDTRLSRDDVRQILRREVRRRVQDERGAEFPGFDIQGDFQEDPQLQAAIRLALQELGTSPLDVAEYARTFVDPTGTGEANPALVAVLPSPDDVASARAALQRAREGDGKLTKETLDHVLEILEEKN